MTDISNEKTMSDKNKKILAQNVAAISNYLKKNNYRFSVMTPRDDISIFNLGFVVSKKSLKVNIVAETNPNSCKISAELPVSADKLYNYPLCYTMAKENYGFRYADFNYNEDTGQVSCEYSFSTEHGIYEDDFSVYFDSVIVTAFKYFDDIRNNCVGRFNDAETDEIFVRIKNLAKDITEYRY